MSVPSRRRSKGSPSPKADPATAGSTAPQGSTPVASTEFPDPSEAWLDDPGPPSRDPARIAAGLTLRRAIASAGAVIPNALADGAVCVIVVPSAGWAGEVQDEWRMQVCDAGEGWDGYRKPYTTRNDWAFWTAVEAQKPFESRDSAEYFAIHVSEGRHCVGISSDISWLPRDLVNAADCTLRLPALTGADVSELAGILCGTRPGATLTDEEAASLTPRLLRLARRTRQTADGYIAKLSDMLRHEPRPSVGAAPTRSSSIRDEPTLERLHGMDEAVAWGNRVVADLRAYSTGTIAWADVDRGCLLSGPPGCGKTLFARALATSCRAQLVTGSYGQWLGTGSGHQGDLLKAMRTTFSRAKADTPSILFIDEVDSFPNRGTTDHHPEWHMQVVNALLAEIDGTEERDGVILIAACNHPGGLDPALVRSGRLDRHIRIGLPDQAGLERILREHLAGELDGADLSVVTLAAVGATGADCERFVRGARRRRREAGRPMELADLKTEITGGDDLTDDDLWLYGVHEAGHAIASCILHPGALMAVSLRIRDDSMGETVTASGYGPTGLRGIRRQLVSILAGRAAEQIIFGDPSNSSGGSAGSDLSEATVMAATAIEAFGLDRATGLVWSGMPTAATVASAMASNPALAERIRWMLDEAYDEAIALLHPRRDVIETLAATLVVRRVLDGQEVAMMVTDADKVREAYRKRRRRSRQSEAVR